MPNLILFAVGPVQDFIASARRTRDLWFGSWLLSDLSKCVARTIVQRGDLNSLIFPAPESNDHLLPEAGFSVANKILAITYDEPEELGELVTTTARARLVKIAMTAYAGIGPIDRGTALKQIDDLLEMYWVALPFSGESDYAEQRAKLEALMAARKCTRDFRPVAWGSAMPKSSLDGQREAVIPETEYDAVRRGTNTQIDLYRKYGVRPGERLCGVGLLKRHGSKGGQRSFFSTSHMASLPLLKRLRNEHVALVDEYIAQLRRLGPDQGDLPTVPGPPHPVFGRFDGQLLFAERLNELIEDDNLPAARDALTTFIRRALGGNQPSPYYALLAADGDRMGKTIDHQRSIADHRRLSK